MSARTAVALAVAGLLASSAFAAERGESAAAREQARLCERLSLEEGASACRSALALGIRPARRSSIRQTLARHLVALEKWDELADHFREDTRLSPEDADAWRRLGTTLLFALDRRAEAVASLQRATRLAPGDAQTLLALGQALASEGQFAEAVVAVREALRREVGILSARPAAGEVFDAAGRGQPWP